MELSKKTTILFSPVLHARLSRLASERRTSLGELVRSACETQYGLSSKTSRLDAVRQLAKLDLPIADTGRMKMESTPPPEELCP